MGDAAKSKSDKNKGTMIFAGNGEVGEIYLDGKKYGGGSSTPSEPENISFTPTESFGGISSGTAVSGTASQIFKKMFVNEKTPTYTKGSISNSGNINLFVGDKMPASGNLGITTSAPKIVSGSSSFKGTNVTTSAKYPEGYAAGTTVNEVISKSVEVSMSWDASEKVVTTNIGTKVKENNIAVMEGNTNVASSVLDSNGKLAGSTGTGTNEYIKPLTSTVTVNFYNRFGYSFNSDKNTPGSTMTDFNLSKAVKAPENTKLTCTGVNGFVFFWLPKGLCSCTEQWVVKEPDLNGTQPSSTSTANLAFVDSEGDYDIYRYESTPGAESRFTGKMSAFIYIK